jgi:hypothetical protein
VSSSSRRSNLNTEDEDNRIRGNVGIYTSSRAKRLESSEKPLENPKAHKNYFIKNLGILFSILFLFCYSAVFFVPGTFHSSPF